MNSWPSRCSGVMASTVDDTQAAAASWLGEADAVPGVALDVALVLADEGDAGEVPGPAGSPAHPASARASRAEVVRLRRRVGRSRDVADSTRRRYVTVLRTAECRSTGCWPRVESREHAVRAVRRRSVPYSRPVVGVHGIRHDRPHAEPSRGPRRRHRSRRRLRPPPRRAAPAARPAGRHLRGRQRPAGRRRAQHAGGARDGRPQGRAGRRSAPRARSSRSRSTPATCTAPTAWPTSRWRPRP